MNGLEISNLTVDLGGFKITDLNLEIKQGCITGLVGRNGAGKTTLLKTIMRQLEPVSGNILYNGMRYRDHEVEILNSIACVFDTPHFSISSRPKNLLKYYKAAYKNFDEELFHTLMAKFNLPERQSLSKYSYGMQKKCNLIFGLCQNPDILILDEPTSGIDPYDRKEVVTLVQEFMMNENHTVLFSTHITEDLDKIADYIVMMENGKITMNEDKVTLTERYRLVQCGAIPPELQDKAIGVQKSMFGYTFLVQDSAVEASEGVLVKVPSVEEMFVHLIGTNDLGGGATSDKNGGKGRKR